MNTRTERRPTCSFSTVVALIIALLLVSMLPIPGPSCAMAAASWKLIGFKGQQLQDVLVDPRTHSKVFAIVFDRGIYRSLDYGKTWKCLKTGDFYAICMDTFSSQVLYLVGDRGMYRSLNGGTTWTGVYVGPKGSAFRSLCPDPKLKRVVYAGNDDYGIVKYTDYATQVDPITSNFLDSYPDNVELHVQSLAVDPTNTQRIFVGTNYDLYQSNDGGETWNVGAKGTAQNDSFHLISSLAVSSKGVVFASIESTSWPRPTVDDSGLFRSSNHGQSWSRISTGLKGGGSALGSPMVTQICFNPKNSNEIFAAADTGVYRTTDGCKTWRYLATGIPAKDSVNSLALDPANPHVLYVAADDGLYKIAF
jgi:hypothetical protein